METVRAAEASQHGLSRAGLYRRARQGQYERIGWGLYRPTSAAPADEDLIEAAFRRPDATLCLTSALAHHDLIDTIPERHDLAIPRGNREPATRGALRWHRFDAATFDLGREGYPIAGTDLAIWIYSPERCIADAFRMRGATGYETARDALRTWLARGGQPAALATLARQLPRATGPLMNALDILT